VKNIIVTLLIFSLLLANSCFEKDKEPIVIDYPKFHFLDKKKDSIFKIIKLKDYTDFNNLTKEINRIICTDSIPKIEFTLNDTIKRIRLINFCYEGITCILIRQKNVIEIYNDSIFKSGKYYPIDSLLSVMNKDFNNYAKDESYSDSPKKLLIDISYSNNNFNELSKLLNLLTIIYEEIQMNEFLNVRLIERTEIELVDIPPPPPSLNRIE